MQKVDKEFLDIKSSDNEETTCVICYEKLDITAKLTSIWAPCCCIRGWFHRDCIQRLALSAGYFFKCPICNDKDHFQDVMLYFGIYIPERDASWELVPNAYEELLHRHNRCDAACCHCPKGRQQNESGTRWEIVLCRFCGSQGIHIGCGNLRWSNPDWECDECKEMLVNSNSDQDGQQGEEVATASSAAIESQSRVPRRALVRRSTRRLRFVKSPSPEVEVSSSSQESSPEPVPDLSSKSISLVVLSDDEDDDVVILDDDSTTAVDNGSVIFSNDGVAIPVVPVTSIPVGSEGENICVVGDVNVRMPGPPQSSGTLVSNLSHSNPPKTSSKRLLNNVPGSQNDTSGPGTSELPLDSTDLDSIQPEKRMRMSNPENGRMINISQNHPQSTNRVRIPVNNQQQRVNPSRRRENNQLQQRQTVTHLRMPVNNQQTDSMMGQQRQLVNQTAVLMVNQQQNSINQSTILNNQQQSAGVFFIPQQQRVGVMPEQQTEVLMLQQPSSQSAVMVSYHHHHPSSRQSWMSSLFYFCHPTSHFLVILKTNYYLVECRLS